MNGNKPRKGPTLRAAAGFAAAEVLDVAVSGVVAEACEGGACVAELEVAFMGQV
jgi:hypothetical protein